MLFVLTEPIREGLPATLKKRDLRDALSNIARAHYEGKHAVSGPHSLLRALGEEASLPEDIRGMYKEIHRGRLEAGSLRKSLSCVVEVGLDTGPIRQRQAEGQLVFQVPLSYFADSARVQATWLIAEHEHDAAIFEKAANAYVFKKHKGITARLIPAGGSGRNTAGSFRTHALQNPTVCIVDADYKWSAEEGPQEEGDTAKAARKEAATLSSTAICGVHSIPCHEIENLFPTALVLDCLIQDDRRDIREGVTRAAELGLFGGGPDVNSLDLKKGVRLRDVFEHPEQSPRRRYLTRVFERLQHKVRGPSEGWCGEALRCADQKRKGGKKKECSCILFEGTGDWLAKRVAGHLESLTPQKIAEHLLAEGCSCEAAWTALGHLLYSWGCAYKRIRQGQIHQSP